MKHLRIICSILLVIGMIVCLASCIFDKKTQNSDFQTSTDAASDSGTSATPNNGGTQTDGRASETTGGTPIELPIVK